MGERIWKVIFGYERLALEPLARASSTTPRYQSFRSLSLQKALSKCAPGGARLIFCVSFLSSMAYADLTKMNSGYSPDTVDRPVDLMGESSTSKIGLDYSLQDTHVRSRNQVHTMLGSSRRNDKDVFSGRAQYGYRILQSESIPLYGLIDVGYQADETFLKSVGGTRTLYDVPITAGLGWFQSFWRDHVVVSLAGGPTARVVVQRGFVSEQNRSDLYWATSMQAGLSFQWLSDVTNDRTSIGVKYHQMNPSREEERAPKTQELLLDYCIDL